jgi:hypothetical protein
MNDSLLSGFEATEAKVSKKRYVKLSTDERKRLAELIRKGKSPAKKQQARTASSDSAISSQLPCFGV